MPETIIHEVTYTDFRIDHRQAGTIARCTCGWVDQWNMQGGNAEASGADHIRTNNHRPAEVEAPVKTLPTPRPSKFVSPYARTHDHNCSCHLSPPCNQCVNCKHPDEPDCDNDCQDCDIDHDI